MLHDVVHEETGPCYDYIARLFKVMSRIQVVAYMANRIPINTSVRKLLKDSTRELNQYFIEVERITT